MADYGSWLNNAASGFVKGATQLHKMSLPGLFINDQTRGRYNDMLQSEVIDKSDLRGAELLEGLSNVPLVGNLIRGVQGVNKLEDLYNNTGRVPYYSGSGVSGAGALGSAVRDIGKIADGSNDLYEFYTGSSDDFRSDMNNSYM